MSTARDDEDFEACASTTACSKALCQSSGSTLRRFRENPSAESEEDAEEVDDDDEEEDDPALRSLPGKHIGELLTSEVRHFLFLLACCSLSGPRELYIPSPRNPRSAPGTAMLTLRARRVNHVDKARAPLRGL